MRRIAVVASHPVQYQAPWFRALAKAVDLTVFFCHRASANDQAKAGFDTPFEWDVPLLHGYRYLWLRNISDDPGVKRWAGCDTPDIERELALGRFEACIINGWYLKSYVQALRACRRHHVPVLVRGDSQLQTPRPFVTRIAKALPYRWLLQRIDAHLYVGQRNAEYLRHYGVPPERLFFAPHFVDNARFVSGAASARADGRADGIRRVIGATEQTTVFLFAGKLLARKRVQDFIDALGRVARNGRNVAGLIVGSGPEEASLRDLASRSGCRIHFAGFQNQSQMPAHYAAADCLVLPSDGHETWGLVVNEAMATGLPAITSDAVGCGPDLIEAGCTGFVFPVGSVDTLADRMLDTIAQLASAPEAVRSHVRDRIDRYSETAAVEGTLQAIAAVCGDTSPQPALRDAQHA